MLETGQNALFRTAKQGADESGQITRIDTNGVAHGPVAFVTTMGIANTLALVRATLDKLRWTVPGVAKIAVTAPSHRPRGAPGDISGTPGSRAALVRLPTPHERSP